MHFDVIKTWPHEGFRKIAQKGIWIILYCASFFLSSLFFLLKFFPFDSMFVMILITLKSFEPMLSSTIRTHLKSTESFFVIFRMYSSLLFPALVFQWRETRFWNGKTLNYCSIPGHESASATDIKMGEFIFLNLVLQWKAVPNVNSFLGHDRVTFGCIKLIIVFHWENDINVVLYDDYNKVYIFYFGVLSFRNNEDKFKYPVVQES